MLFGKKKVDIKQTERDISKINRKRVLNDSSSFDVRESFNELRTNVLFSLTNKGAKKVLITSSLASEGKSTTALNMAISFAETGVKTLIVDCDLRRPNQGKLLDDKEKKGLSNILVNDCKISDALHETRYKNLDVVLTGSTPPNPTELLSSDGMKAFIDEMSEKYDYIILDTPPINMVTDAAILSSLVNGVIVVCRQYVTEKKILASAIEKLQFVDAKIIGIVLNDVSSSKASYGKYARSKYSKYGYYGYYGYGYGYKKKEQKK